jgi:multiple sugar transport system ATP-binding protein
MAGLVYDRVSKSFGDVLALRDLDLEVPPGELVVLAGPSGSGKTTALRVAAGLEAPSSGRVLIADRDVTALAPVRRNVSMVFQSFALFPHLSAEDNIGFGLVARRVPKAEVASRVRAAAERAGCAALLERRPFELSGGERQRVALARALVREPDVFLLDEPLSSLDAQTRVEMRAELRLLQRRVGATMVYVTHDQVEALTLADRLAVLREGELQQVGTPDDVYGRPVNRFVATFVGSPAMNVLPAVLDDGGVRAGGFVMPVPDGARLDGRRLELGIRPEHLTLTEGGVPAEVEVVEPAGSETYLRVRADELTLTVRTGAERRPAVGGKVAVGFAPHRAYVFDAESGETLLQARPR